MLELGIGAGALEVVCLGAHPDDIEIGCGATLLRHRRLGHAIMVLTLSRGAVGGEIVSPPPHAQHISSELKPGASKVPQE